MSDDNTIELVRHLRIMARYEHGDMAISANAADEITRLRAENIHLRRAGMDRPSAELHEAALAELRAEIERLRARVEVLRKELTDIAEYCDELDATVSTISYAARRALARTAEEAKP